MFVFCSLHVSDGPKARGLHNTIKTLGEHKETWQFWDGWKGKSNYSGRHSAFKKHNSSRETKMGSTCKGNPTKCRGKILLSLDFPDRPPSPTSTSIHVAMSPKEESVIAVVPTNNLIMKFIELQSRALVVGHTLGEEVERTTIVVVTKLKTELAEPSSSLKAMLEAMRALEEKMRQVYIEVEEAKKALKSELEKEKAEGAKENAKVGDREREKKNTIR